MVEENEVINDESRPVHNCDRRTQRCRGHNNLSKGPGMESTDRLPS